MGLIIGKPPKIYSTIDEAIKAAEQLNCNTNDDWEYLVSIDPNGSGRAIIQIFDENREYVGEY